MNRIGSYGIYQSNYYDRTQSSKTGTASASDTGTTKAAEQKKVQLSDAATKLLKEMKKTYGNTDFIIADYETDEEAAAYLSRGRAKYSVLITPDELEKMAADENVKKENLKVLDDAFQKLDQMKDQLGEKGKEVSRLGISIGNDGEISYFAELEKVSEKQRERIEEKRESNREDAREATKEAARKTMEELRGSGSASTPGREPLKRTTVQASSVEELLEKIGQVNWDDVPDEMIPSGHRFDYTV